MEPLSRPNGLVSIISSGPNVGFADSKLEAIMGEFTDKAAAAGNKLAGNVKEAIGKATDNEQLVAEGEAQQVKGTAQNVKGSVKGALGDDI
jgi:uncharacterized protein YjbJ (UPF0337 family)